MINLQSSEFPKSFVNMNEDSCRVLQRSYDLRAQFSLALCLCNLLMDQGVWHAGRSIILLWIKQEKERRDTGWVRPLRTEEEMLAQVVVKNLYNVENKW